MHPEDALNRWQAVCCSSWFCSVVIPQPLFCGWNITQDDVTEWELRMNIGSSRTEVSVEGNFYDGCLFLPSPKSFSAFSGHFHRVSVRTWKILVLIILAGKERIKCNRMNKSAIRQSLIVPQSDNIIHISPRKGWTLSEVEKLNSVGLSGCSGGMQLHACKRMGWQLKTATPPHLPA